MPAFYSANVQDFLVADDDAVIGALSSNYEQAGYYQLISKQTAAWKQQIAILKFALNGLDGDILFEYPIPRRGKRIDNVLLINGHILAIECKMGSDTYFKADSEQLEDYCLDLQDFHKESRHRIIVPVLLASEAPDRQVTLPFSMQERVLPVQFANKSNLKSALTTVINALPQQAEPLHRDTWDQSHYEPTPTIIETAQQLYAGKSVHEITRSHAGAKNLTITSRFVIQAIEQARQNGQKMICFVTGVPGAGKTLAGLNIVHSRELNDGELGAFLSGNIPLVEVLSEALARDDKARNGNSLGSVYIHLSQR